MKLCLFRRRAFTNLLPVSLNGSLIEFRDFTNGEMNSLNAFRTRPRALGGVLSLKWIGWQGVRAYGF